MQPEASRADGVSHPPIVLVVEDDESNRDMYSLFLESSGLSVISARDGTEGLSSARRYQPQVVVTDVCMPGMSGWDLARTLRENEGTAGIGIIAVSGRPIDEAEIHLKERHVDVVLEKPCLPEELLKAVRALVARSRLARIRAGGQLARAQRLRERSARLIDVSQKHQRRRR